MDILLTILKIIGYTFLAIPLALIFATIIVIVLAIFIALLPIWLMLLWAILSYTLIASKMIYHDNIIDELLYWLRY